MVAEAYNSYNQTKDRIVSKQKAWCNDLQILSKELPPLPVITNVFFSSCSMWLTCSVSAVSYCLSIVVEVLASDDENPFEKDPTLSAVVDSIVSVTCNIPYQNYPFVSGK